MDHELDLGSLSQTGTLPTGSHEFGYEAVLRHISNLAPSASVSMREAAGQSIKSAVYHSWTRDTRDDKILGTRGSYAKFFHELAGAGGDASFYKAEAHGQLARSISPGVVRAHTGVFRLRYAKMVFVPQDAVACRTDGRAVELRSQVVLF